MPSVLALISTSFIVISAIFVAFGWVAISRRNIETHQKLMKWAAVFATSFFIIYLSRTAFLGSTTFGGPEYLKLTYTIFLIFHILLATTGAIMGLLSLYYGYKNQLAKHRKIGPWTSIVWFCTAITGVTVFMLLYVVYPPGNTDSLIRAILGL
jgi:putative membrane protein